MKRAPRSRQRHDLYAKYHDYDSEISDLLGECGPMRFDVEILHRENSCESCPQPWFGRSAAPVSRSTSAGGTSRPDVSPARSWSILVLPRLTQPQQRLSNIPGAHTCPAIHCSAAAATTRN